MNACCPGCPGIERILIHDMHLMTRTGKANGGGAEGACSMNVDRIVSGRLLETVNHPPRASIELAGRAVRSGG